MKYTVVRSSCFAPGIWHVHKERFTLQRVLEFGSEYTLLLDLPGSSNGI